MSTVTFVLDGKQVVANEGMTLLDAARQSGIDIPTLCESEQVRPSGACRMCLVEVCKGKRKKLVASCLYQVEPDIQVTTENERIRKNRKLLVELMWPASARVAARYGVTNSRFQPAQTDCSLCGLCVRYCADVAKKNVVYFKGRGIDRQLAIVPGMEDECASCQQCFGLCSGGWIAAASSDAKRVAWKALGAGEPNK